METKQTRTLYMWKNYRCVLYLFNDDQTDLIQISTRH